MLRSHSLDQALMNRAPAATRSLLQRQCACGQHKTGGAACEQCRHGGVPSTVEHVLRAPGAPLAAPMRVLFEDRFAHDFSQVRVHTDHEAAESARQLSASAYTVGSDIVFGAGRYAPDTSIGRHLLAHELVHTIQQRGARRSPPRALRTTGADGAAEREADRVAQDVLSDRSAAVTLEHSVAVARQSDGDAGAPDAGAGGSREWLERHLHCVIYIRGGCPQIRAGGVPDDAEVARYDHQCRPESGYTGPVLTVADLSCDQPALAIARSLSVSYPNWLGVLPDCPCTDAEARKAPDTWRGPGNCDPSYHPGAATGYRSTGAYATLAGTSHGQQCCYDRAGKLISSDAAGAGTPDVWSPATHLLRHVEADVDTWRALGWQTYNQYWVPNAGSGCSPR